MIKKFLLISFIALSISSCGRYGDPQPPEYFAPQGVKDLSANANISGVEIKWVAPDTDRSGDQLKSMEGYFIERRIITKPSDILDPDVEDVLIATIPDTHLKILKELRKKAIEEGKISRKVSVEHDLKEFKYFDEDVTPGTTYIYSIVPFNQGETRGLVPLQVKVLFRGDASVVTIIETEDTENIKLKKNINRKKTGIF